MHKIILFTYKKYPDIVRYLLVIKISKKMYLMEYKYKLNELDFNLNLKTPWLTPHAVRPFYRRISFKMTTWMLNFSKQMSGDTKRNKESLS